jgi:hypothetical protein
MRTTDLRKVKHGIALLLKNMPDSSRDTPGQLSRQEIIGLLSKSRIAHYAIGEIRPFMSDDPNLITNDYHASRETIDRALDSMVAEGTLHVEDFKQHNPVYAPGATIDKQAIKRARVQALTVLASPHDLTLGNGVKISLKHILASASLPEPIMLQALQELAGDGLLRHDEGKGDTMDTHEFSMTPRGQSTILQLLNEQETQDVAHPNRNGRH